MVPVRIVKTYQLLGPLKLFGSAFFTQREEVRQALAGQSTLRRLTFVFAESLRNRLTSPHNFSCEPDRRPDRFFG